MHGSIVISIKWNIHVKRSKHSLELIARLEDANLMYVFCEWKDCACICICKNSHLDSLWNSHQPTHTFSCILYAILLQFHFVDVYTRNTLIEYIGVSYAKCPQWMNLQIYARMRMRAMLSFPKSKQKSGEYSFSVVIVDGCWFSLNIQSHPSLLNSFNHNHTENFWDTKKV